MSIKKVNFGPIRARFWPVWTPNSRTRFFPDMRFLQKTQKHRVLSFWAKKVHNQSWFRFSTKLKNRILCPIWPLFAQKRGDRIFPEKSESVSFLPLRTRNFMCDIRQILWANFEKSCKLTGLLTDFQKRERKVNFGPALACLGQCGSDLGATHEIDQNGLIPFIELHHNTKKLSNSSGEFNFLKLSHF